MTQANREKHPLTRVATTVDRAAERLVSLSRIGIGFVATVLTLLALLLGRLPAPRFAAMLGITAVLVLANATRMYRLHRGTAFLTVAPYALSVLDMLFVLASASLCFGQANTATVHLVVMGGLSAAVGLSSLYHKPRVVTIGGVAAVVVSFMFALGRAGGRGELLRTSAGDLAVLVLLLGLSTVVARSMARYFGDALRRMTDGSTGQAGVLARLPQMAFGVDGNARVLWATEASRTLFGMGPPQMRGVALGELVVLPDGFALPSRHIRVCLALKEPRESTGYVECELWPAPLGRDGAEAWEGVMCDVSERERLQREREAMVERLHRYQKMDSLGALASGMAHDFNNVVQRVTDSLRQIGEQTAERSTRERIAVVETDLGEARELVSQLLSLGSSDALSLERLDMREFIPWVAELLAERHGSAWQVRHAVEAEPMPVRGDRAYLRRVVENLVRNAVDAMPEGGSVELACATEAAADGSRQVVLRVSDTGPGIPPELVERIFDPFVSGKKKGKGTGLGLALTQHILTLHKASITVERTGMLGTTFRIAFPLAETLEVDRDTRWMASRRKRARVLVLDDDAKIRDVLKSFLMGLKYEVCEAESGDTACAEVARYRDSCRVAVMDWKLAGEEPGDVIRALRRIRDDLIVMVVSGYAPDQKSMEAYGIRRWFTKPYDRNLLDLELQRALYLADKTEA